MSTHTLRIILGDQLNDRAALVQQCRSDDCLWMAEVAEESTHVKSHKQRIVLFLSAMRHFAERLRKSSNCNLEYHALETHAFASLREALSDAIQRLEPRQLMVTHPGERRVLQQIEQLSQQYGLKLSVLDDEHFMSLPADFSRWADGRKTLRMEYFYRDMRRRYGVLMDGDQPVGGKWNYDADNRGSFAKSGPGFVPSIHAVATDSITESVVALVDRVFADHPGTTRNFDWPCTREDALVSLRQFIDERLIAFGDTQDAMWTHEPYLYHARLSAAMNLKLINPREIIAAVESAWRDGHVPLNAAEGFIRQVLGWREYVRGLYWHFGDHYRELNALQADESLPGFFWTGNTDMHCLSETIQQTLDTAYAHHIQRLMITGLFCLLLGVRPKAVHEWYLAIYADAVEWVELPNTLGMALYADGGLMASKPYAASGKYIDKMSNYCAQCKYSPGKRSGDNACPYTVFYWDFLARHADRFEKHPRMALQIKNLARVDAQEQQDIIATAKHYRDQVEFL